MRKQPELHSTEFLKQLQEQRFSAEALKDGTWKSLLPVAVVVLAFCPFLIPVALVAGLVIYLIKKQSDGETASGPKPVLHRKKAAQASHLTPSATFTEGEDGIWLSAEKQLEQLDTLYHAGLLEPEEYRMKRNRILGGQ